MTDYHPVTEEELDQIKNACVFPERIDCEECKFIDMELGCGWKGANALMDEVLTRPDPLEVLEKWREWFSAKMPMDTLSWAHETPFIKELRTNPDAVMARGKSEGWL